METLCGSLLMKWTQSKHFSVPLAPETWPLALTKSPRKQCPFSKWTKRGLFRLLQFCAAELAGRLPGEYKLITLLIFCRKYSSRSRMYFIIASNDWVMSQLGSKFSTVRLRRFSGQSESLPDQFSTTCSGSVDITKMKNTISWNDGNDPDYPWYL